MKYMGSKRWMLQRGLAAVIQDRIAGHRRFVDLFSGSAAVSWHVAMNHDVPVLANDLQKYCGLLAASVICRTSPLGHRWIDNWVERAQAGARAHRLFRGAQRLDACAEGISIAKLASCARALCATAETPVAAAYGGHYFSPLQAIHLDSLRQHLPSRRNHRLAGLGALIQAASACAASPGHTAQPFSPTESAGPYLRDAWSRDIIERSRQRATSLANDAARRSGEALTGDANTLAHRLGPGDLVFVDPPYSSVHYSRFYHVLETIALGRAVPVSGTGRYPPPRLRPRSRYSLTSESHNALRQLLRTIGTRGCGALITFPAGPASNGLSGGRVVEIAEQWFKVDQVTVKSRFSTLGGNTRNRSARVRSEELLLSLHPK